MNILLAVSGGIAAYKAVEVLRLLRDAGHSVRCAMTRSASSFIAPLTLEVLSENAVLQEEYLTATGRGVEGHLEAADWADLICVVPATANRLTRSALGLADDFLGTTLLSFAGPVVFAPAMHPRMWEHPSVRQSLATLEARDVVMVGPVVGPLASGEVGVGRLAAPSAILTAIEGALKRDLAGVRVLVSAGPTHEPVDPVRYLGNRSSGQMGFAIAGAAARRGADVFLVAGPVSLPTPPGVQRTDVETALEMEAAMLALAAQFDLIVMAAAVADFRPARPAEQKLKKAAGPPLVELVPNPDILSQLPAAAPLAVVVGFAAETRDLEAEARRKLESKQVDFIVANDVSRPGIGFSAEDNEVLVVQRGGEPVAFQRLSKVELGDRLVDLFVTRLRSPERAGKPCH